MRRFEVKFDDNDARIDQVLLAIAPIDAFTGRIVASKIEAEIGLVSVVGGEEQVVRQLDQPIRNLSGMLVFVISPEEEVGQHGLKYRIFVKAQAAGYFDPAPFDFEPPAPDDEKRAEKRQQVVSLFRLPTADLGTEATVVAGVLIRDRESRAPIVGARVLARVPSDGPLMGLDEALPFETRSAEKGAFAMRLRLQPVDGLEEAVPVTFTFEEGPHRREFTAAVREDRFQSFDKPIELTGENEPALLALPR